jgi:hypothetical protein
LRGTLTTQNLAVISLPYTSSASARFISKEGAEFLSERKERLKMWHAALRPCRRNPRFREEYMADPAGYVAKQLAENKKRIEKERPLPEPPCEVA